MYEIYRLHGVCLLVDVALPGQMHFNRYEKIIRIKASLCTVYMLNYKKMYLRKYIVKNVFHNFFRRNSVKYLNVIDGCCG